jgi:hypothetical protein
MTSTFNMGHLAQIRHIQPDDYSLRPIRVIHEGQRIESLQIGFPDDESETTESKDPSKPDIVRPKKIVTASQIEERKQQFHNKLLNIVKSHHNVSAVIWSELDLFNDLICLFALSSRF